MKHARLFRLCLVIAPLVSSYAMSHSPDARLSDFLLQQNQQANPQQTETRFGLPVAELTGTIAADRPGFSTSPLTVAPGHFQIESGYTFTKDGDFEEHTAPQLLLRAGVLEDFELRLNWAGYSWSRFDTASGEQWSADPNDLAVEAKYTLFEQDETDWPTIGVLGSVSLPTGGGNATSDDYDPTLGFLWTYDTDFGPSLFGTILMSSLTAEHGRFFQSAAAVGAGFGITDKLGSYVEYFGIYSDVSGPSHNLNGGLTYLLTDNLQLDINGGFGLNGRADDLFIGGGVAWRW